MCRGLKLVLVFFLVMIMIEHSSSWVMIYRKLKPVEPLSSPLDHGNKEEDAIKSPPSPFSGFWTAIKSPPLPFSAFWPMQRQRKIDGRIVAKPVDVSDVPMVHFSHLG
eukprot:02664.XXX_2664_3045_1 [CDS] Oithona nana genome sequencing.